jgi:hypothetical protein
MRNACETSDGSCSTESPNAFLHSYELHRKNEIARPKRVLGNATLILTWAENSSQQGIFAFALHVVFSQSSCLGELASP